MFNKSVWEMALAVIEVALCGYCFFTFVNPLLKGVSPFMIKDYSRHNYFEEVGN